MKITKEQGRACLASLSRFTPDGFWKDYEDFPPGTYEAIKTFGWLRDGYFGFGGSPEDRNAVALALAMCVTLSGIRVQ